MALTDTESIKQVTMLRLREVFRKPHLDMCSVRDLMELNDRQYLRDSKEYKVLNTLHCVNWKDMPGELQVEVIEATLKICTGITTVEEAKPFVTGQQFLQLKKRG